MQVSVLTTPLIQTPNLLELQRVLFEQLVGSILPETEGLTTEKQLDELKLACCNMKCLVVIGEQANIVFKPINLSLSLSHISREDGKRPLNANIAYFYLFFITLPTLDVWEKDQVCVIV